ncbi:MAG: hypothetical protein OXB87_03175 [Hyphomicrobiales bacterium]|nr:hypothetical protein [Hyphomicrobiales bacterium]
MPGLAHAGGGDGYYSSASSSGDRAAADEGSWTDWMDQFGSVGESVGDFFEQAAGHAYLGARGGLNVYDASEGGEGQLSGYNPAEGEGLDLSPLSRYTEDVDYGASASLVLGFDFTGGSEHGGIRTEADVSYMYYTATRCYRGITETQSRNDETLATLELAQAAFDAQLTNICAEQDAPVWNFLFNTFYDVKLDGLARMAGGQGLGMLAGLDVNLGVGVGYMLAQDATDFDRRDKLGRLVLVNDALEPRYANGALEQKSGDTAAARATLSATLTALATQTADLAAAETALAAAVAADPPNTAAVMTATTRRDGARLLRETTINVTLRDARQGVIAAQGVGDANRDNTTVVAPEPLKSGLYVPLYAGFSYSLNELIGFPVTAEVLYRYAVVAPQGFEETHSLFGGVRYHF